MMPRNPTSEQFQHFSFLLQLSPRKPAFFMANAAGHLPALDLPLNEAEAIGLNLLKKSATGCGSSELICYTFFHFLGSVLYFKNGLFSFWYNAEVRAARNFN
jgi:hypothetical protein